MEELLPRRIPPTFTEIDHPRVSAMRSSERARERSLLTGYPHKVSVMTHQPPARKSSACFEAD